MKAISHSKLGSFLEVVLNFSKSTNEALKSLPLLGFDKNYLLLRKSMCCVFLDAIYFPNIIVLKKKSMRNFRSRKRIKTFSRLQYTINAIFHFFFRLDHHGRTQVLSWFLLVGLNLHFLFSDLLGHSRAKVFWWTSLPTLYIF